MEPIRVYLVVLGVAPNFQLMTESRFVVVPSFCPCKGLSSRYRNRFQRSSCVSLFNRDTLGEISWLVYVAASFDCYVVGQQL